MEEYAVPTMEAYQGFIDKPSMDAKYLNKPPFLYVLQIFLEVSNKTGFGKGLFTPQETTKEHYTDPTLKLLALKKINALVKRVEPDEPYELTVENIVRGTECDKTNRFLQMLAQAAKKGTNTDDLVAMILERAAGKKGGSAERTPSNNQQPGQDNNKGGHLREVAEMTKEAKISGGKGHEEGEDASKIRMGTLNRGKKDTKVDDKNVTLCLVFFVCWPGVVGCVISCFGLCFCACLM